MERSGSMTGSHHIFNVYVSINKKIDFNFRTVERLLELESSSKSSIVQQIAIQSRWKSKLWNPVEQM